MPPITRETIKAHLESEVRVGFLKGMGDFTPLRAPFCEDAPSNKPFEVLADMGTQPWPVENAGKQGVGGTDARTGAVAVGKRNAGSAVAAKGGQERSLLIHPIDWEITIPITMNAIDDDRVGDLERWAMDASENFEKHKDKMAFNALNDGAATTNFGACYDGLSMFNDSHFDKGAEFTTTQDNLFALALSLDNYETVQVAGANFLDDRGESAHMNHSLLVVSPANRREAFNISGNPEDEGTTDRKVNPYDGKIRTIVAPGGQLDSTAWFAIDGSRRTKPLVIYTRKEPELETWVDLTTGDGGTMYFKYHARYNIAYGDWRLALMGNT